MRIVHPYRKLSEFLYDRFLPKGKRPRLADQLEEISLQNKESVRSYYIEKISLSLLLASVIAFAAIFAFIVSSMANRRIDENRIIRPGYGADDEDRSLSLSIEGQQEPHDMSVHISSRKFTKEETDRLLKKADTELQTLFTGENPSADQVRSSLVLPDVLEDGLVSVEYFISPSDMIDDQTGQIIGKPSKSGTPVTIEAALSLQGSERISEFACLVYPPVMSSQEKLEADLQDALKKADEDDPASDSILLPEKAGQTNLTWKEPQNNFPSLLLALVFLLPAALWIERDEKVKQLAQNRRENLDLDYSELLFKLTLLLGAGLTIRGAFSRICIQADTETSNFGKSRSHSLASGEPHRTPVDSRDPLRPPVDSRTSARHPVYGEIRLMLREISRGVPEGIAYENFGRRCGLPQYVKLGSLLAQNLKKGSRGLTALLEKEAFLSLQQHRTAARKMGEKASMKMLLPMILMFVDVMIILMVPAMLNL